MAVNINITEAVEKKYMQSGQKNLKNILGLDSHENVEILQKFMN